MKENTKIKTIKKNYEIKVFTITKDNIQNFDIMTNRRLISEAQVQKIHGVLLTDENPIGVLIVNTRGNKMRLIDGNHRMEAIKRFYAYKTSYSNIKIECVLKIFTDLSNEEEKQIYSNEADRRNESYEDRLNMYKDTFQFWKNIQNPNNEFTCKVSIYKQKGSARFRLLLDSLITAKNSSAGNYSPVGLRKINLIKFAKTVNWDDFIMLKEYMKFFQENFGIVDSSNLYMKTQIFMPLFDIWVKNRASVDAKDLARRFKRIINKPDIIQFSGMNCREVNIKMRGIMVNYMNFGTSVNKFI